VVGVPTAGCEKALWEPWKERLLILPGDNQIGSQEVTLELGREGHAETVRAAGRRGA